MTDVFLSYSRLDRPAAETISLALEASGWSVWWDRKIGPGDSFDKTIERELESARCVVVLWSRSSVDSDWVKNEAAAAVERNTLLPVMIDNVRLPIEFRRKQTVDLSSWNRAPDDPLIAKLLNAVTGKLTGMSAPLLPPSVLPKPRSQSLRRTWLLAAIVSISLGVTAGIIVLNSDSTDYTLVCKGGGAFGITTEGFFATRIAFSRAAKPAIESMEPGQCAWTDRAINSREPTELCYSGLFASTLAKRFATNDFLRQQAHFDHEGRCLRITRLL